MYKLNLLYNYLRCPRSYYFKIYYKLEPITDFKSKTDYC